jgi:Mn-dependent DtxR family transcriptional regulator
MGIPVRLVHYFVMLLLSFAVVAAMQTVGVILVVAMLITPASTALLLQKRLPGVLLLSAAIGLASAIIGLLLSIRLELPPGPAIAVTATGFYALAVFFAPGVGLVARLRARRQQRIRIQNEDVLKALHKQTFGAERDARTLAERLGVPDRITRHALRRLARKGLVRRDADGPRLTDAGRNAADELIRAHRLWESYLAAEYDMPGDRIHAEAERLEHMLTPEQVDAVDRHLGYPMTDPHGSPIPASPDATLCTLDDLFVHQQGRIALRQPGADIPHRLWELGLGPGDILEVMRKAGTVMVRTATRETEVPADLARRIALEPVND